MREPKPAGRCASTLGAVTDAGHEREALERTSREWAKVAATDDVERIVSYWTDDGLVLAPDQPPMMGKAALREYVRATQSIPGFSITWEPVAATVSADGTMGYLLEHNRATFTDPSGERQEQRGKAVTIWRKDAAGAWKCVVDIWNGDPGEWGLVDPAP